MSISIEILATDSVSAILSGLGDALTDRTKLNEKISLDELALVQDHLTNISNERHDSANRLGAEPSGFWANPGGYTSAKADASQATIHIDHPGIGRAAHDVDIVPGHGKQYLTLPLLAVAYNQRARSFEHLFVIRSHEGALFLARHEDPANESGLEVLYLLVRSVHQPQDRTLLPPDEAFLQTAMEAAQEYFDAILALRDAA